MLSAVVIVVLIFKPIHFFEHRGGGGRGGGDHGSGAWHGGGRVGGWGSGRRGWGRWNGWNNGGWGWVGDPYYLWNPYYVTTPISYDNQCDLNALEVYKSCVDKGSDKTVCAKNLDANLKVC